LPLLLGALQRDWSVGSKTITWVVKVDQVLANQRHEVKVFIETQADGFRSKPK
jgi:hypothetical protein